MRLVAAVLDASRNSRRDGIEKDDREIVPEDLTPDELETHGPAGGRDLALQRIRGARLVLPREREKREGDGEKPESAADEGRAIGSELAKRNDGVPPGDCGALRARGR
jgi:hypothetical protein